MHEEPRDKMNIPVIVTVSLVMILLVILSVVTVQAYFRYEQEREAWVKIVNVPNDDLDQLNHQQLIEIQKPRWVDRDQDLVAIPIDRAMKLYAEQQQGR